MDDETPVKVTKTSSTSINKSISAQPELPTLENVLKPLSPQLRDLFFKLRERILALGDDVREVPGKWWVDYRKSSTFVSPNIRKSKLSILIKIGDQKVDDPKSITSHVSYYGRLNTRFNLNSPDELDYAMHLIKQAYAYIP